MSKIIDLAQFRESNGPDLSAKRAFLDMSIDELWNEIISFRDSSVNKKMNESELKKAMALFDVAYQKSDTDFLKMFSEMYINNLKQEMKVLKNTYSK